MMTNLRYSLLSNDLFAERYKAIKNFRNRVKIINKQKIFCIGRNKTGTSSLKVAMQEMGYISNRQKESEMLFKDWVNRDFRRIIKFCHTAQFFHDLPFGLPYTYIILDNAFKGSKFILTIRDNPEQWYNSITKFHAKLFGKNGQIPTKKDLKDATYNYKGMAWIVNRNVYNTPEDDPYNKEILINHYINHNTTVIEYFNNRPDDLLILNVAEKGAYQKLANFLGKSVSKLEFPWVNKT